MHPFIDVARALAEQAADQLNELLKAPLTQKRKADRSWVTNADYAADAIIRTGLHQAFPEHAILTEESGFQGSTTAEYLWVVDPLDGTRAYLRGIPGYSVMIGLLRHGAPFAGVVVDPVEGRTYEAVIGKGAFEHYQGQQRPLHVSERAHWQDMPVITSTGFPDPLVQDLRKHWTGPWITPMNSVGIKVGLVVRQIADLYINHHGVHYWDTVAPQVILEAAGGQITYGDGSPLTYRLDGAYQHATWTLASNGRRHREALETAAALLPRLTATPPNP